MTIKNFNLSPSNVDNFINKLKALDLENVRYVANVVEKKTSRSIEQNNLMWAVLTEISNQLSIGGKKFSPESWHHYFKIDFLPEDNSSYGFDINDLVKNAESYRKWEYVPNGGRMLSGSTADLTTKGFSEYMEQIYSFAASEGVIFDET